MAFWVRKDSSINTIADLKGKRVPADWVQQTGVMPHTTALLAAGGITYNDVVKVPEVNVVRAADDFKAGKLDLLFFAVGAPKVAEVAASVGGLRLLPMDPLPDSEARMKKVRPEYYFSTVNPGAAHRRRSTSPRKVQTIDFVVGVGTHVQRRRRVRVRQGGAREQEGPGRRPSRTSTPSRRKTLARCSRACRTTRRAIKYFKEAGHAGVEELSSAAPPHSAGGARAGGARGAADARSLAWSWASRQAGLVLFPEQFARRARTASASRYSSCSFPCVARQPSAARCRGTTGRCAAAVARRRAATSPSHFPRLTALAGSVTAETLIGLAVVLTLLTFEGDAAHLGWSLVDHPARARRLRVLVGHLVPGQLRTHKVEPASSLIYLNFDNNGLLGLVLQITVIVIIAFVLMGQLLTRSGGSGVLQRSSRIAPDGPLSRRRGEDGGGRLQPVRHDLRDRRGEHASRSAWSPFR